MDYAKFNGNNLEKYPCTITDIKRDNPKTSFPPSLGEVKNLQRYQIYPVVQADDPTFDPATHYLVQGAPVRLGNNVTVTRVAVAYTQGELDAIAAETAKSEDIETLKQNASLRALVNLRPEEIDTFINGIVADESVKSLLKNLTKAVAVLSRRVIG